MANSIKLTPAELTAQSEAMKSLAAQYEGLFKNVNSTMRSVNANWSKNLSNNFSGKINSAQRGFSNVVSMLEHGAAAAGNSAKTLDSLDKQLAKVMNGEGGASSHREKAKGYTAGGGGRASGGGGKGAFGAQGSVESRGGIRDGKVDSVFDELKEGWKNSGESVRYLEEQYAKLPKEVREKIETAAGGDMRTALKITGDILKGEVSLDTLSSFLKATKLESVKVSAITKTFDIVWNKKGTTGQLIDLQDYYEDLAASKIAKGHIAEGLADLGKSCAYGLGGIFYGSAEILTELGADALDAKTKIITTPINAVASVLPGNMGKVVKQISGNTETAVIFFVKRIIRDAL